MNNTTTATIRTAIPAGWGAVVLWLLDRYTPIQLTGEDLLVLAPAVIVVTGIVYRAARELESRWPTLGRIFFGSSKTPTY